MSSRSARKSRQGDSPKKASIEAKKTEGEDMAREPEANAATTSFWSYVRNDDKAIYSKISQLRQDIVSVYKFTTGQDIAIFMDRENIGWGQQWERVIHYGITRAVFMMPIVTPNFMQSPACRTELLEFHAICQRRGLDDLILPIVFSGLEQVSESSDDEVAKIIAKAQYEDFSEVWPHERGSAPWASAVKRLVSELVKAESRIEDQLVALLTSEIPSATDPDSDTDVDEDAPGLADLAVILEPAIEEAGRALNKSMEDFTEFAGSLNDLPLSNEPPAKDPRGLQAQILRSAAAINGTAVPFESSASTALERVSDANNVVVAMKQTAGGMYDPSLRASLASGMGSMSEVRNVADQIDLMMRQIADIENLSAALRKELRPARKGMRYLRDAARLVSSWEN